MPPPEANWTVEIVRIVATGGIALFGAWIGFGLANRGRKYDLLYKERFASFKVLADNCLVLRNITIGLYKDIYKYNVDDDNNERGSKQSKLDNMTIKINTHLSKLRADTKDLILMDIKTRKNYEETIKNTEKLVKDIGILQNFMSTRTPENNANRHIVINNVAQDLRFIEELTRDTVNYGLTQQGLPEASILFEYQPVLGDI